MKKIRKGTIPSTFKTYYTSVPDSTWKQMKNDAFHHGQQAYKDIKSQTIYEQGGLCAYCEIKIQDLDSSHQRIEHFHPKSDISSAHNWAMDWNNIFAVCMGGSKKCQDERYYQEPLPVNLSCDAHKDHAIGKHVIPENCEGYILNPLDLHLYPSLFDFEKRTGKLKPASSCNTLTITPNHYASTIELVEKTIEILNLNADRLCKMRLKVFHNHETIKKNYRNRRINASEALSEIAERYFSMQWPEFFTTRRILLGKHAEDFLERINYQG